MSKQIAFCWLLLKSEHWIPVSPMRKLTAADRSSSRGPVIMAEIHADVEDNELVRWRHLGSLYHDVDAHGLVLPLDTRPATSAAVAPLFDALLRERGVIGINQALAERRRAVERTIPEHLRAPAFARAATQIRARLNGHRAVGVMLRPILTGAPT